MVHLPVVERVTSKDKASSLEPKCPWRLIPVVYNMVQSKQNPHWVELLGRGDIATELVYVLVKIKCILFPYGEDPLCWTAQASLE